MDVSVRASIGHEQLRLFDPDEPHGVPIRVWLGFFGGLLVMSGDLSLTRWEPLVVEAVRERFARNEQTVKLVVGNILRLFKFTSAHGIRTCDGWTNELVHDWCWAPRSDANGLPQPVRHATARHRQWAALVCFQEAAKLGCPIDPLVLIGERIPRPPPMVSARPLRPDEERRVQQYADTGLLGSQRALLLALSFAGGTAQEVAQVRMGDLNLADGTVAFLGEAARTNRLDEWSTQAVARWWNCLPQPPSPDEPVCVGPHVTAAGGARSVTVRLGDVLADADIRDRPGVSPGSVRLTGARRVLERSNLEAAARFLGAVSLDRTADALEHDWREGDA